MKNTVSQYNAIIKVCRDLFVKKTKDYGTAWRILRTSSLTDQIYIKAKRIRSIQENKGAMKVHESIDMEFVAIVNYSIMALIQLTDPPGEDLHLEVDVVAEKYDHWVKNTQELMLNKNHDYGEAWRDMRISSMTDLILMKLMRIKSIEENDGKTLVSEGLDANFQDIMNYAVFCLILISEKEKLN